MRTGKRHATPTRRVVDYSGWGEDHRPDRVEDVWRWWGFGDHVDGRKSWDPWFSDWRRADYKAWNVTTDPPEWYMRPTRQEIRAHALVRGLKMWNAGMVAELACQEAWKTDPASPLVRGFDRYMEDAETWEKQADDWAGVEFSQGHVDSRAYQGWYRKRAQEEIDAVLGAVELRLHGSGMTFGGHDDGSQSQWDGALRYGVGGGPEAVAAEEWARPDAERRVAQGAARTRQRFGNVGGCVLLDHSGSMGTYLADDRVSGPRCGTFRDAAMQSLVASGVVSAWARYDTTIHLPFRPGGEWKPGDNSSDTSTSIALRAALRLVPEYRRDIIVISDGCDNLAGCPTAAEIVSERSRVHVIACHWSTLESRIAELARETHGSVVDIVR